MNDVRTPSDPGQNTHPSIASSFDFVELLAELHAFRRDFDRAFLVVSTDALADRDLGTRQVWTGLMLSASDAAFVLGRLDNAAHETACHLVTQYSSKSKPPKSENDGEGSDDDNEDEDNE